jgi:hypothetical protein
MVETRKCARKLVRRSPSEQREYEARKRREQRERIEGTRQNAVGGVTLRKRGGRGPKLKKGKGENASDEAVAPNDTPPNKILALYYIQRKHGFAFLSKTTAKTCFHHGQK